MIQIFKMIRKSSNFQGLTNFSQIIIKIHEWLKILKVKVKQFMH